MLEFFFGWVSLRQGYSLFWTFKCVILLSVPSSPKGKPTGTFLVPVCSLLGLLQWVVESGTACVQKLLFLSILKTSISVSVEVSYSCLHKQVHVYLCIHMYMYVYILDINIIHHLWEAFSYYGACLHAGWAVTALGACGPVLRKWRSPVQAASLFLKALGMSLQT
jgi:hypothetical protein